MSRYFYISLMFHYVRYNGHCFFKRFSTQTTLELPHRHFYFIWWHIFYRFHCVGLILLFYFLCFQDYFWLKVGQMTTFICRPSELTLLWFSKKSVSTGTETVDSFIRLKMKSRKYDFSFVSRSNETPYNLLILK